MSSCYQVTGLVSLSYERPLTVKEQFLLKSHLAICAGCRGFYKNSQTLHKMMKAHKQHQKDTQKP
ncbi:MAG: dsDNA-mimic protein [Gammaproteobacteria bacterium]|nr:MAG: dsDNA-mimic protein [Gammaproteobacteria bacterium]